MTGGTRRLSLVLLSLAVLDLTLETVAPLHNTSSNTAATFPPSRPPTSTPEMPMDAFTSSSSTAQQSPAASNTTTPQVRGTTVHSTPVSPGLGPSTPSSTPAGLGPTTTSSTPTGLGPTTSTPASTSVATTRNCDKTTTFTSVGTSTALTVSSFGVDMSTLPSPTSTLLSSTWMGTTLGTSTHQGPAMTTLLGSTSPETGSTSPGTGSTSPGTGNTSSSTTPAVTDTSDEPLTSSSDTTASFLTTTEVSGSTPAPSQPVGTTARTSPGTSTLTEPETPSDTAETSAMDVTATMSPALPTSSIPMESSTLLPTIDSTTTATLLSSSPETEASTPEESSTSLETGNTSPPTAVTDDSTESLTALTDTTASPVISTPDPMSTPSPSNPARTTPDIFLSTLESTPGTEPSSPAISSAQTSEVTLSTDLPMLTPVCPSASSNTSVSQLFLSLRLTTPLDLGNTTVQELVLSKLREDLQTAFPCAGLSLAWRGKRRT